MPIRTHAPSARLVIGLYIALLVATPAGAEQAAREEAIAACTHHQLSIGDLDREEMLEKVSRMDWRTAKDACRKSFVPGEIGWREAYTFAQALVAESNVGSAPGDLNREPLISAIGYLYPSLIQDNAEPYLFLAYLSLTLRSATASASAHRLASAPRESREKTKADAQAVDWAGARTAERWLLISSCLGSGKAFEVLSDFYVRNALDGTMLPNQRREFEHAPFAPLLKRARDEGEGVAAEYLGSRFVILGKMSRETPTSIAGRQDDWRIAAAWHWVALSYFARAHGWERLAHERAEAGSRESDRSKIIAEMARRDAETYVRDICGPYLRAHDLSEAAKIEHQPPPKP